MITLEDACQKVLAQHPNEYIHVVNEYKDFFMFILLNNDEKVCSLTFFWEGTEVNKKTGEIIEHVDLFDKMLDGDYKQYSFSAPDGQV